MNKRDFTAFIGYILAWIFILIFIGFAVSFIVGFANHMTTIFY